MTAYFLLEFAGQQSLTVANEPLPRTSSSLPYFSVSDVSESVRWRELLDDRDDVDGLRTIVLGSCSGDGCRRFSEKVWNGFVGAVSSLDVFLRRGFKRSLNIPFERLSCD